MVKMTDMSFLDGILSPTNPFLTTSARPDAETAYVYGNGNSSWDCSNYGDLSRNAFSLKQKAAMLIISLQHFHHIWPRRAGNAAFIQTSLSLCLRFVSYWWGSRGRGKRQQQLNEVFLILLQKWLLRMQSPVQALQLQPFHTENFPWNWE